MDTEEFVDPVNENFLCGICEGVLIRPMCCKEGHSYCHGCITPWLAQKAECPMDRSRLTEATLTHNRSLENVRAHEYVIIPSCDKSLYICSLSKHCMCAVCTPRLV